MRILVTNDDGPPSNQSSPYVHSLITALQQSGHDVSVCLPHVQRSWIGKAHMIGQTLTPSYFRPGTILKDDGTVSEDPFNDGKEEWVLIDGTPASCVQIGLHHAFKDKAPFELVISGPNYGRNTTAVFALSSGTLGGAMEGAVNGVRSIALSYAFDSREHDAEILAAASRVSTRLIEKLNSEWPDDVHLYSINVPLRQGVEETKIVYTQIIQNRWYHSSFTELSDQASDADPNAEEKRIREDQGRQSGSSTEIGKKKSKVTYKWSPQFADVRKAVEEKGEGDGWSVIQGHISVTPLRANFWHAPKYTGEIKLHGTEQNTIPVHSKPPDKSIVHAYINHPDLYVQPLVLKALAGDSQIDYHIVSSLKDLPDRSKPVLQVTAYEDLDFEQAASYPSTSLLCAYIIRKALIRKHYLSNTISTWLVKHPESSLTRHFKPAIHFELDFAEFLDDALVDAWELNESMQRNDTVEDPSLREWWILKPGMSDGGNGIRLFSTMKELQEIFEEWEPPEDEDDNEDDDGAETVSVQQDTENANGNSIAGNHTMTSQLRHFIAQLYIDPPLLIEAMEHRKFHIRTYVVAVGALKVYVYREMLALFAAKPYAAPGTVKEESENGGNQAPDLSQHLTNTCFQDESMRSMSVHRFWAMSEVHPSPGWQRELYTQICDVTGEVFEAAAREQMIHFQTLPNAFEIFGVDFLVDADLNVWLLELNAYPDFKQTGEGLQETVVGGLFKEVVKVAVNPFFGDTEHENGTETLQLVKRLDLGRG